MEKGLGATNPISAQLQRLLSYSSYPFCSLGIFSFVLTYTALIW